MLKLCIYGFLFQKLKPLILLKDAKGKEIRCLSNLKSIPEASDINMNHFNVDGELYRKFIIPFKRHTAEVYFRSDDVAELIKHWQEIAQRDSLTSLYNRAGLFSNAQRIVNDKLHNDIPFVTIMADVDRLKYINDNFGHRTGNEVIRATARVLQNNFRQQDVVARIGGDEFAIITQLSIEESQKRAAKIVADLHKFEISDYKEPISLSIGIAKFNNEEDLNQLLRKDTADIPATEKLLEIYLSRADKALYRSKIGENKISIYSPEIDNDKKVYQK